MSFILIHDEEELVLEFNDDTGDGKPGRLFYRRVPYEKKRLAMIRHGGSIRDPEKWPSKAIKGFKHEIVRYGYKRAENFIVQLPGGSRVVDPTVEEILKMPDDFLSVLVTVFTMTKNPMKDKKKPAPAPVEAEAEETAEEEPDEEYTPSDDEEIPPEEDSVEPASEEEMLGNS